MMKPLSLLCGVLILIPLAHADIIFDVDFESPPHTLDAPVTRCSGNDVASSTSGDVVVRDSLADFTTQVASLEPAGAMSFSQAVPVSAGLVTISWDMAIIDLGPTGPETAGILIQSSGGGGGPQALFFNDDLTIDQGSGTLGTFTLGEQDHFEYLFDLDNDLYSFSINGSPAISSDPLGAAFDVQNVVFGADFLAGPDYAVDNFQWSVIPEPSSLLLMLVAGLGLWLRRLRVR